jgi:hypothetical protein
VSDDGDHCNCTDWVPHADWCDENATAAPAEEDTGAAAATAERNKHYNAETPIVTHWSGWNSFAAEENGLIVGLSGYGQSGKDTAAGFMADYGFTRLAFADQVRAVALACNPSVNISDTIIPLTEPLAELVRIEGWEGAKRKAEVRILLQHLGVAVREHVDPDAWVNALFRQTSPGRRYVVTDVRFPNEAAAIKARGGIVVRVHRPGVGAVNAHLSETALDDWDFDAHLFNDGDLDAFRVGVQQFLILEGLE